MKCGGTMKIEVYEEGVWKARHKLVRLDDLSDIPGEIVTANEETGECAVTRAGEMKQLDFGPGGFRIVERGR
jgi:hypothetical protein